MNNPRYCRLVLLLPLLLAGCGKGSEPPATAAAEPSEPPAAEQPATAPEEPVAAEPDTQRSVRLADHDSAHATVKESFVTEPLADFGLDSVAMWHAPVGGRWLYASAKEVDRIVYFDGDSGLQKGSIGGHGDAPGEFARPNGVFVIRDLLLVVERDNRRVQVFALPALTPLGSFGAEQLQRPYGLWARDLDGGYEVIVSDSYMQADDPDAVPALEDLGRRFWRFQVTVVDGAISAEPRGSFGDTAAGAIRVAESLVGDEVLQRLLIAEEDQASGTRLKVYDLAGQYADRDVGSEQFKAQAEGIALFQCPDGTGYWIATDQFVDRSLFHLFDRQTLEHVGSFGGETTANTDGIWLSQAPTEHFPHGVLYAVHDDRAVAAFDWKAIAEAVDVRHGCDGG